MEAYEGFASLYDIFMDNIDYSAWADYIKRIWDRFGIDPELVCDIGCGTGSVTAALAGEGCDMIGIDISEEMLAIAREKSPDSLFLCQDMQSFELYGTVGSIISVCDSVNYITEPSGLLQVFKLVNNYLDPGGLFIFDMNTEYKFKEILADNNFSEAREDCAFIWENYYDEDEKINEYAMTFFAKNEDGSYLRFDELHCEAAYSPEEIRLMLEESGLEIVGEYDAFTFDKPHEKSERICYVAREKEKEKLGRSIE